MLPFCANKGKRLDRRVNGVTYLRYPVKTHVVSKNDVLEEVINHYVGPFLEKGDIIVLSERCVAITQGRSYLIKDIHPSGWAQFLSKFVTRRAGGIGLGSPWTMELALHEVGLFRILLASAVAALTRPFGLKGIFYTIAGGDINAIDGPCSYSLSPGDKSAKLGPKDPMGVARHLTKKFHAAIAIIDANDFGVRVMGYSPGIVPSHIEKIFVDNPLGQSREQTPIALIRRK